MILFLTLLSGVAWTVVYADAIRVGFRDRSYAIPVAALALNIAWESIYAVRSLRDGPDVQGVVNLIWFVADVIIVWTFLRYGRAELPAWITRKLFAGWALLMLIMGFTVQLLFVGEFGWSDAPAYAAFLQNLLMSVLFIAMLVARGGTRGQTLTIAVAKWVGTLAPTLTFGVIYDSPFILGVGVVCSVFDLVYIGLVWTERKRQPAATRASVSLSARGGGSKRG